MIRLFEEDTYSSPHPQIKLEISVFTGSRLIGSYLRSIKQRLIKITCCYIVRIIKNIHLFALCKIM